ncbi:N-acetyltransferase family protein [Aminobacter sp. BE322]|uniref:GNAT family N-acetyltransferase n=1 Tax=unclassified Aminobacter TaxID=2644704 RepID=UPI003D2390B3
MFVRLGLEEDIDAVTEMARMNIEETRPGLTFNEFKCRETYYSYLDNASPTIFVVEDKREVIGFLLAEMYDYRAADGLFTTQEVLFVRPDKRGTRAAVILMKHLVAWSEQLGAKEIIGGNDNEFNSERTAKFLEHFGFERVGFSMRRVTAHGRR